MLQSLASDFACMEKCEDIDVLFLHGLEPNMSLLVSKF